MTPITRLAATAALACALLPLSARGPDDKNTAADEASRVLAFNRPDGPAAASLTTTIEQVVATQVHTRWAALEGDPDHAPFDTHLRTVCLREPMKLGG